MVVDGPAPPATASAGTFLLISWQRKAKMNLLGAKRMAQAAVYRKHFPYALKDWLILYQHCRVGPSASYRL